MVNTQAAAVLTAAIRRILNITSLLFRLS
uniref:Uncharacterized protein n=1 Tax=Arundo donax TaxID=35708 RepID=A0A0A9HFG3_ARUDO